MQLSSYQRRIDKTCRAARAILILLGGVPKEMREELDTAIRSIPFLTKRRLRELDEFYSAHLAELDANIGLIAPPDEYIRIVEEAIAQPFSLLFVPKVYIDRHLFRHYDKVSPRWHKHAPHMRMGVDIRNELPFTGHAEVEFRLLEAGLFEDMAMLWNECIETQVTYDGETKAERIPHKKNRMLKRCTARAVFAMLEGYINGVAVDIEWTMDMAAMTVAERELITERAQDGRQRFKRFRDKILQYPKIALGLLHPPIPESTPELALILRREREWRDAVMHPSPRTEEEYSASRERAFFEIDLNDLRELVDAAISLVRKIDTALAEKFGSVEIWLEDRGADGRFPETVFY